MQDGENIDIHTYIALVKSLYQNANVSVFTIKIDDICLIYRIIQFYLFTRSIPKSSLHNF